jgi:hypothetical protein
MTRKNTKYLGIKSNLFLDITVFSISIFVLAVMLGIAYFVMHDTYTPLINMFNASGNNVSAQMLNKQVTSSSGLYDGIIMFIIVGLWIASIISAFMLDSHPIFAIVLIIMASATLLIGMLLANVFETIALDSAMNIKNTIPMTYYFFTHWLIVGIAYLFTVGGAIYAKNQYM